MNLLERFREKKFENIKFNYNNVTLISPMTQNKLMDLIDRIDLEKKELMSNWSFQLISFYNLDHGWYIWMIDNWNKINKTISEHFGANLSHGLNM